VCDVPAGWQVWKSGLFAITGAGVLLLESLAALVASASRLELSLGGTLTHVEADEEPDEENDRDVEDVGCGHRLLQLPGLEFHVFAEASFGDGVAEQVL
jgi:hypothetical protein